MTFYIFSCSTSGSLFGATDEPTGAKLPAEACSRGTWVFSKQVEQSGNAFSADEAEQDIRKQGYHLFRPKVERTTTVSKKP